MGDGLESRGGGDCKQKLVEAGLGRGCEGREARVCVVTVGKWSYQEELTDQVWGETGIKANSRVCA